jgi:hypothetical protein
MGQKRTPQLVAAAKRLKADGRSLAEIAADLSKGGKSVSKASVLAWLKDSAPAPAPPPPVEVPPPVPLDESEIGPDYVVRTLRGLVRREREREARLTGAGDEAGAQRAGRLAGQFAVQLAKLQSKDDEDGDVVKVRAEDVQAAADRALADLGGLADRVAAERATWPKCAACGQPCGDFPNAEKSPLRAMFERVVSG